jgi:hypothetical protein
MFINTLINIEYMFSYINSVKGYKAALNSLKKKQIKRLPSFNSLIKGYTASYNSLIIKNR